MSRQLADASASAETTIETTLEAEKASLLKQPKAVWATALAAVFAFMGIGLVDPILPAIAKNLQASTSEVSLLFTSYFLVTAVAMLISGFVSSRIGGKKTLLIGLAIIVVFASLSGLSGSVEQLVGFRAGWGLGNALFVATALAVIVGVASGGTGTAIILYEAALGLGISLGPLLGALLGGWQWRAPFFGTAVLMAAAFIALLALLPKTPAPAKKSRLRDPLLALGHKGLRTTAASALFYNYGFFTILAFTPFILGMDAYGIGGVFFGWGVAVAVFSVFVAPVLQKRFGAVKVLTGTLAVLMLDLVGLGLAAGHSVTAVVVLVIVAGALLGINNTVYTELAMGVSDSPRPVASAGYNFVRWMGGALAPFAAAQLGEHFGPQVPFFAGAVAMVIAILIAFSGRSFLSSHEPHLV
ncbi:MULTISPECIES: MFS transporter [Paenarthrobacter]|jgi:predicted MFS family arabinose efflux permease|uniref:MFS transporter n=1 Tax=Paenarthrobacter TaxID=1742992 RepID=UPI000368E69E|nr:MULTISPECIES: MFS transporter [Paenarthrobacter]KIA71190.1 major facilitator transporter [Arthrobacter sp. MWB30]KQR01979.1 MFS transporter [Arthrobacter sp. Leaf145]SKC06378.1 Predicted arabinose efflux permease, MFS family [Arthrobacter sp. 31Cvi3.1E]BCW12491.1 MFS transporter [Arthrobacter sp. NtRootA2]BCW16574.1 MFS transporter [Arthrobacter sp. NtRootA4]BCW24907.1 MFS transporter [Arthrobacter sp. NtRootC7]BCW29176.1 MFS transporter [Arthrobacter sp. NtRootC45]BCW33446.1 MFS transpo